ncbi:unnamed protein product [Spodoptera exigua]|nr:unnamed protein product [Spodoptera exigua]
MGPHFEREHRDFPFKGPFGPQDEKKKHSGCPFSRSQNSSERGPPPFMFGPGFGPKEWHHGSGHHGPKDCHRGPSKDCHKGWFHHGPKHEDGPSPHHFFGHHGFRHGREERHHHDWRGSSSEHYGPPRHWFGRRGPSESEERPKGPWGKPWGPWAAAWGSDQKP